MTKRGYIEVPKDVWETAFACFAGHVGVSMQHYDKMPHVWSKVFLFACDDAALKRLGITNPPSPSEDTTD